jgi:hypothetical protein
MAKFFILPSYTCNEINLKFCFGGRLISCAYTSEGSREDSVHRPDQAEGSEEELTTEKKIIETSTDNCLPFYCIMLLFERHQIFKKAYGTHAMET